MRTFFVVAAISAVKAQSDNGSHDDSNAYVIAQDPYYYTQPIDHYAHAAVPYGTHEVYADVPSHHGSLDSHH